MQGPARGCRRGPATCGQAIGGLVWGLEKGRRHRKRGLAFQSLLQTPLLGKAPSAGPTSASTFSGPHFHNAEVQGTWLLLESRVGQGEGVC